MSEQSDPLVERLRAAGCVFAEDEAALLRSEAADEATLEQMIDRRVAGIPLEQIVGWVEFCGTRLSVAPGVFVPRLRTSLLVEAAAERCHEGAVVVDLCCGIGAVLAALVDRVSPVELYGTEIDPAAVSCARANLRSRATIGTGDLYDPLPAMLRGTVDLITANAPYVPTEQIAFMPTEARDHERRAALDGGADGLDLHRRIIDAAPQWLAPGGWLLIETGRGQVDTDLGLLTDAGFTSAVIVDDEIAATVVAGRRGSIG